MVRVTQRIITPLGILALAQLSSRTGPFHPGTLISRGGMLRLGGAGLAAILTGTWRNHAIVDAAPGGAVSPAHCVPAPEQTEGPYYSPREKVRRNITEHHPGTPLTLRLAVVDGRTCKPIKGAGVDIWHCDAGGVYSGFESASAGGPPGGAVGPTDKHTFLRGIQFTDAEGYAEFESIYPGWYRGRTVHIHVKVHLNDATVNHVVHTGQLYFSDSLTGTVYRAEPYKARAAARDTFNKTDGIYQNGGRQSMLTMKRHGRGYIGTITLGVHP
jgi:protocatechuate 3,4-dioxygenase beta subunit